MSFPGQRRLKARFVSPFRVCSDFASKAARRDVEEQEDLAAARRVQNVAINELETAQQAVTVLQNVWLQEFKANGNTEEAKQAEAKKDKAKKEVEKAEEKVKKATQEVEKAKKAASASVQAGRGQAGLLRVQLLLLPLICTPAWSSFPRGPPFLLFGVVLSSRQGFPRR